jgi:hypothetical protein
MVWSSLHFCCLITVEDTITNIYAETFHILGSSNNVGTRYGMYQVFMNFKHYIITKFNVATNIMEWDEFGLHDIFQKIE